MHTHCKVVPFVRTLTSYYAPHACIQYYTENRCWWCSAVVGREKAIAGACSTWWYDSYSHKDRFVTNIKQYSCCGANNDIRRNQLMQTTRKSTKEMHGQKTISYSYSCIQLIIHTCVLKVDSKHKHHQSDYKYNAS